MKKLTTKQIKSIIKSLRIGESDSISPAGSVTRDTETTYTVQDNGVGDSNLDFATAVRIAKDNQ